MAVKATTYSKYRVQFFGKNGRLLREVTEPTATYDIRGDEGYVRAKVLESNGRVAWVQLVMVKERTTAPQQAGLVMMIVAATCLGAWRWSQ